MIARDVNPSALEVSVDYTDIDLVQIWGTRGKRLYGRGGVTVLGDVAHDLLCSHKTEEPTWETVVDGVSDIRILTGRVQVLVWYYTFPQRSWPTVLGIPLTTAVFYSVLMRLLRRCRQAALSEELAVSPRLRHAQVPYQ